MIPSALETPLEKCCCYRWFGRQKQLSNQPPLTSMTLKKIVSETILVNDIMNQPLFALFISLLHGYNILWHSETCSLQLWCKLEDCNSKNLSAKWTTSYNFCNMCLARLASLLITLLLYTNKNQLGREDRRFSGGFIDRWRSWKAVMTEAASFTVV